MRDAGDLDPSSDAPEIHPGFRLTFLLVAVALVGALFCVGAVLLQGRRDRDDLVSSAQDRHAQALVGRLADAFTLSVALRDVEEVERMGKDILARNSDLDGLLVRLDTGEEVRLGQVDDPSPTWSAEIAATTSRADLVLLSSSPLGVLDRDQGRAGTVTLYARDPGGFAAQLATSSPLRADGFVLLGAVVSMFLGAALFVRYRLLQLASLAEAIAAGRLHDLPWVSGKDEVGWIAAMLAHIGTLVREQVDRVHGTNLDLLRDVAQKSERLERLARFATVLVTPVGETSAAHQALGALAHEVRATIGLLFAPDPRTNGFSCSATYGFPNDRSAQVAIRKANVVVTPPSSGAVESLATLEPAHPWMKAAGRRVSLSGVVQVGLRFQDGLEGFVILATRSPMAQKDRDFLVDAARPLAIALANRRAYEASVGLSVALTAKNQELLRQRDELAVVGRLKSQFVANMSHELRTPLNAILGYAELLADEVYGPVTDEQKQALEGILATGRHLLQIINQVLDLSRAEAGHLRIQPEAVDLRRVLDEVVRTVTPLCHEKPYRPEASGPSVIVHTDAERVHQILTNLMGNAIKFTDHGHVVASVAPSAEGGARIIVRDTGIGIDPANMELIFEEFRQVDGSSTRVHDGAGLGLAISKRLAKALGGSLTARSVLGQGSEFSLALPARCPAQVEPPSDLKPEAIPVGAAA